MALRILLIILLGALVAPCQAEVLPSEVLDLSRWKLTLPYDTDRPGEPDEVLQPELATFEDRSCFFAAEKGDGVVFRASCDGEQTENSSYPRSELREMQANGEDEANWSTARGDIHTMELDLAVSHLPRRKPHVVCAQIHDDEDDILMVRVEDHKLFIERSEGERIKLDWRYEPGRRFTLRLTAADGRIKAWYNDREVMDWKVKVKKCYFKAGCYTQSNIEKEKEKGSYGEVVIYRVELKR